MVVVVVLFVLVVVSLVVTCMHDDDDDDDKSLSSYSQCTSVCLVSRHYLREQQDLWLLAQGSTIGAPLLP